MLAVVSDSSPIIYLTRLELFPLLGRLHETVVVPPAVWNEITVGGVDREEARNVHQAATDGWLQVKSPASIIVGLSTRADLGRGEVEAIALAKELNAVLLTDDADARQSAQRLAIRVSGTIGLLVRAKDEGHVHEVRTLLDKLRLTNFRMSESLYRHALAEAGENQTS